MATLKGIALMLAVILIAVPITGLVALWTWAHFVQSPRFARTYFDGVLAVEEIVESRRWHWRSHPWGGQDLGCTYAIVNISGNAPRVPPSTWNAEWSETPMTVPDGHHEILKECSYLWPEDLVARLTRAQSKLGSYYSSNSETLLLYSPQEGLAARIRFGD